MLRLINHFSSKKNMTDLKSKIFTELNPAEKSELIAFRATSYYPLIRQIMENMIHEAKDLAMAVDPVNQDEQRARMTEAHAMSKFYTRMIKSIEREVSERMGQIQEKAIQSQLDDREFTDNLLVEQASR